MVDAIRHTQAAGGWADAARLLADGFSNREIATQLFVSENTVKTHCARAFDKLGAARRTQAVQRGKEVIIGNTDYNPKRMAEMTSRAFDRALLEMGPAQLNIPRDFFYGDIECEIPRPLTIERGAGEPAAERLHAAAPVMQARVIEIYEKSGFVNQAIEARKEYVARYGRTRSRVGRASLASACESGAD